MSGVQQKVLFDSHCHWDHPKLQALQPGLWQACVKQGVQDILVPATTAAQWPALVALCKAQARWHLAQHQASHLSLLQHLVTQAKPLAIGEIGLDWHLPEATWAVQEALFIKQLRLAQQVRLPVILHVRKCHDRVIKLLRQQRFSQAGFVHAFSGNEQQAKAYADMGFKLGVGGTITYARASETRNLISRLPLSWLVLETDAPDMPMSHQVERLNHPDDLPKVLDVLAVIRMEDRAQLAQQTTANCLGVLGLSK